MTNDAADIEIIEVRTQLLEEYDFKSIFEEKGWRDILELPSNQKELISYGFQLIKYILDGPTKGVDVGAKQEIFHLINQIAKDGNCVIYATCENSELLSITDRMYVMYDGRIMAELETAKTTEDEIMHYATGSEEKYAG